MCARHTHTNTNIQPICIQHQDGLTSEPLRLWRGSVGLTPPVACLAAVSGLPVVLLPGEQRTEARCPCGAEQGVEPRPRQTQDPHHDKLLEMHSTRGLQSDLQHPSESFRILQNPSESFRILQNPSESFSFVAFSYIFLYFVARCSFRTEI